MIRHFKKFEQFTLYKIVHILILVSFVMNSVFVPGMAYGQTLSSVLSLPVPGTMVTLTPGFNPAVIQGMTINPQNPLQMDFIIHPGDRDLQGKAFEDESRKLIKYFLAALTVPEDQLWVNLSPYEKNRIITPEFGDTEMGRDLLAQDYMLKQLSASLMYPEDELGQTFWKRVHQEMQSRYGTTEIPMNTFNKIWIVPEKAVVHRNGANIFVVESKLKVLLEEDYVALEHNSLNNEKTSSQDDVVSGVSSEIVREILIPAIEHEVNEGETFANLRQIYHSLILAAWYKKNLKESLLGQVYVDQGKTKGIETGDKTINQKIYDQYIAAFKKGVYNYIREDVDPATNQTIPRKYFSGGVDYAQLSAEIEETARDPRTSQFDGAKRVQVNLNGIDGLGNMVAMPQARQNEDSALIARLGTNQTLDYYRWGQKGANFKLLKEIKAILFPDREDDLFPTGVNLLTEEVQAIRQDPSVLLTKTDEILGEFEQATGKKLGDAANPLFISVRSSPEYSMPDQLDTILNIGMTETTIQTLIANGAEEKLVLNAYRRFIGHFATIVMGIERSDGIDFFFHRLQAYLRLKGKQSEFDLTADEQRELIADYKERIQEVKNVSFPENDPRLQLTMAIEAIAQSWDNENVRAFRDLEEIPHDSGYAVIIQEMKFGNLNDRSGAGILFSRDAATGKNEITGDFMLGKQGTAVVSGKRSEEGMQILQREFPDAYRDLENIARILERRLARVVDIEFTIENGKLYILQIRPADIKIGAERRVFEDFLEEGILDALTKVPYLERIQNRLSKRHILKVKDNVDRYVLFQGDIASAGAIQGYLVFSIEKFEHLVAQELPAILAFDYSRKANFKTVLKHSDKEVGLIANFGTSRSHIGIMTNKRLIPAIINPRLEIGETHMEIDGVIINEGDMIVLDGNNVQVFQTSSADPLEVDRNVMKIAIEDDNVMDNRRTFLEDGNFINKTSPLAGTYGAAEVLAMNWDERAELITPQQARTLLKDEYTVARLLELNWIAWHEFLEAEAAEAKNPGDELLHIETDTKTQRKTFLHELLTLRGYIDGLPEGRTDAMQDEYINGEKIHRYTSEIVFERTIPAEQWEAAESNVREDIFREMRALTLANSALVLDLRKAKNSSGGIEYHIVLLKASTMEKPVDVKPAVQSRMPGLLETLPNQLGIPVSSKIEYDDELRFRFILGDYQVRDASGSIVNVSNDYWSPDEMHTRREQIERLVNEAFGGNLRPHFQSQELRGHQRKGNGYIGYAFWFTQDVGINEETLRKQADNFSIYDIAVDGHRDDAIDLTRKKLVQLTQSIPGLHVDEMMYRYERTLGQSKIPTERRVFKIWKEYAREADMESLRTKIKLLLYKTPADIRNYAYLNGDVYDISFPMVRFTMNFPQDYVDDMRTLNFYFLSNVQRQAAINGLNILLKKLNQAGYNLPRDDERSQENVNIEVVNNVSGDFTPSNHRSVLRHLPFVFGLKDHDSSKEYNFYKSALVISLEMLINIGVRGSINKNESDQIDKSLREAGYVHHDDVRTIPQILGDQAVLSSITDKLKEGLGIPNGLTRYALSTSLSKYHKSRSAGEANDLTRALASLALQAVHVPPVVDDEGMPAASIKAAGITFSSPLDVTLVWETQGHGQLKLTDVYVDAGGGPVNSAKTFANHDAPFGLAAISYPDPLRKAWEGSFSDQHLKKYLVEAGQGGTKVNVINIVDGNPMRVLVGRGEPISDETISRLLLELDRMLTSATDLKWLMLTAGGGVAYDRTHYVYGTMVEKAHDFGVDVLIDFKYSSTEKEIRSVLEVERKEPRDILVPNINEFVLILEKLGIAEPNTLKRNMGPADIEAHARTLIERYNLKGILVTRGKQGLVFVPREGDALTEPGIPVHVRSITAAGDATSAGFVLALIQGKSYAEAVHEANVFGAATVSLPASQVATKAAVQNVQDSALLAVSFDEGVHAVGRWISDKLKTKQDDEPLVIAINGAPGAGKTTLKKIIVAALKQRGFEKDKDNVYTHLNSQRYIHYYEELWESLEGLDEAWEKNFYGHNGIVIVESVVHDVPQAWHNRDNLLLVQIGAGRETRKGRLTERGSSEELAKEKAAYDGSNLSDFAHAISIINDDQIINMLFLSIQKLLYSYDQAVLADDAGNALVREVRDFYRLYEREAFDPSSLEKMYQSAVTIAQIMEIDDIEGQRVKRLAESGGYDKGYLLFREREPGGGTIIEENKKGRLLRDGTLQPRIDNDTVSDQLGDWAKATEPQRVDALKDKLKEEFDDIVYESERVLAGQTDRKKRLAVVLTNFMEAVRSLQALDQAMLTEKEVTWAELTEQGYDINVQKIKVASAAEAYYVNVTKNGILLDESEVLYLVYPDLKLIYLGMYFPDFPEKNKKGHIPGSGRALLRHLFNPEQYGGYHIVSATSSSARKSFLKMQDYQIDRDNPEVVMIAESAAKSNDRTPLRHIGRTREAFQRFYQSIVSSSAFGLMDRIQQTRLQQVLQSSNVHLVVPDTAMLADVPADPFEQRLLGAYGVTHLDRHAFNQALLMSGVNAQVISGIDDPTWEELKTDIEHGMTVNELIRKGYRAKLHIGSVKKMAGALQLLTKQPKPLPLPVIPIFTQHWGRESATQAAATMMEQYARLMEQHPGEQPKVIWVQEDIGTDLNTLAHYVSTEQMTHINETFRRIFDAVKDQYSTPYLSKKILTNPSLINSVTAKGLVELMGIFTSLKESSATMTREMIVENLEEQSAANERDGRVDYDLEFNLALLKSLEIYPLEFHREIDGMSFETFLNLLWSDYIQLMETMAYVRDNIDESRKLRRWGIELHARSNMIERDLNDFVPFLRSLAEATARQDPNAVIVFVRGIEHERIKQLLQPGEPRPEADPTGIVDLSRAWKDGIVTRATDEDIDREFITHLIENIGSSVGLNREEIYRRDLKGRGGTAAVGKELRQHINQVYKEFGYPNGLMISFTWLLNRRGEDGQYVLPAVWDGFIREHLLALRIAQYRETSTKFFRYVAEQFRSEEFRMAIVQYFISLHTTGLPAEQRERFAELALRDVFGGKSAAAFKVTFPALFDDELLLDVGNFSGWMARFVEKGYKRPGLDITPGDISTMSQWFGQITTRQPFLMPVAPRPDAAVLADVPETLTVNQQKLTLLPLTKELLLKHKRDIAELINLIVPGETVGMLEQDLENQAISQIQYDPEMSFVVMGENGLPVGMAIAYRPKGKNHVYLSSFSVDPALHGTAVSSWLLYKTFRTALNKNLKTAYWETYPKATTHEYARANGYYRRIGAYPLSVTQDGLVRHMEYVQDIPTLLPRIYDHFKRKELDYAMLGNTAFHQTSDDRVIKNILFQTEPGRPVIRIKDGVMSGLTLGQNENVLESVLTDEDFNDIVRRDPQPVVIAGRDADLDFYLNRRIPEEVTIRISNDGIFVDGVRQPTTQPMSHDLIHIGYALSRKDAAKDSSHVLDVVVFQTLAGVLLSPIDRMMEHAYEELAVAKAESYYAMMRGGQTPAAEKLERELDPVLSAVGWTQDDLDRLITVVDQLKGELAEKGFVDIRHTIGHRLSSADLTVARYDEGDDALEDAAMLSDLPQTITLQARTFKAVHITPALLSEHLDEFAALMTVMNPKKTLAQMQERIAHLIHTSDEYAPMYSIAVIDQDGKAVGMSLGNRSDHGEYLYLSTFVIDPALQGSPLASWLLHHTFYNAHADGLNTAKWETFPADSSDIYRRANAFYRKIGAIPVKDTPYDGFRRMEFVYNLPQGLPKILDEYSVRLTDFAVLADGDGTSGEKNDALPAPAYTMAHTSYKDRIGTFLNWLKQQTYLPVQDLGDASVVDIGSSYGFGTAELGDVLSAMNPRLHVYGVDPAADLETRRQTITIPSNVTFIQDDHRLKGGQRPKNVRMIVSMNMFMYYDAPGKALMIEHMNEYLEEGGLMVLGVGGPGEKNQSLNFLVLKKQDGRMVPLEILFNKSFYSFSTENSFGYWQGYFSGETAEAFRAWVEDIDPLLKEERNSIRQRLFKEGMAAWERQEPEVFEGHKELLRKMGFHFNILSDGSVSFPLDQVLESVAVSKSGDQAMMARQLRILVVDDHEGVRRATRNLLRSMNHEVLMATDGKDALRVIDEELQAGRAVDMVITDHNMPEMNGEQLVTHLKQNARYSSIPVIMNSAQEESVLAMLSQRLGVPVISKPFSIDALEAFIKEKFPDAADDQAMAAQIPTKQQLIDVFTTIDGIFATVLSGELNEAHLKESAQAMVALTKTYPNPYLVHLIQDRMNYLGTGLSVLISPDSLRQSIENGRKNTADIIKGVRALAPDEELPVVKFGIKPVIDHEKIAELGASTDEAMLGYWGKDRTAYERIIGKLNDPVRKSLITSALVKQARTFTEEGYDFDVVFYPQERYLDHTERYVSTPSLGPEYPASAQEEVRQEYEQALEAERQRALKGEWVTVPERLEIVKGPKFNDLDGAMLSHVHDDKTKQLLRLMQRVSYRIYHAGPMNVKELIDAAEAVNPGFRHPFSETQLERFDGEQFERMIRLVNEQILIPVGLIIHGFKSDGSVSYLTIEPGSWKEEPYLGGLSVWTASVKAAEEHISDAFSLGWFAFIDHQTREKFYREMYQRLRRGVQTDNPGGITALYGRLFKNLNLSERDFVRIMLKNVLLEEKIHARDAAYTAGLKGDYRTLFVKAPEILIAQTIARPDFEVLQRGEGEPGRLNWLAVMEFSAKLQGTILEMEEYLEQGREDLAYFLFFDYIRNQMDYLTSHNEHNHNVAIYFVDELLERRLVQDDKLLAYLNRDPSVSPARQALELLQEIYAKHFYSEEERLQTLKEKGRDQVRLPGPLSDQSMLGEDEPLIILDQDIATVNISVDNAMLDELLQPRVLGGLTVLAGIGLYGTYQVWQHYTVNGNIHRLKRTYDESALKFVARSKNDKAKDYMAALDRMKEMIVNKLQGTKKEQLIRTEILVKAQEYFEKYGDFQVRYHPDEYGMVRIDISASHNDWTPNFAEEYQLIKREYIEVLPPADQAQLSEVGGIDLNPKNLTIETQGQDQTIPFNFDARTLQSLDIQGFVPVIINISPVTNIPLLLGVSAPEEKEQPERLTSDPASPLDRKERLFLPAGGELSRL